MIKHTENLICIHSRAELQHSLTTAKQLDTLNSEDSARIIMADLGCSFKSLLICTVFEVFSSRLSWTGTGLGLA